MKDAAGSTDLENHFKIKTESNLAQLQNLNERLKISGVG